MAVEATDGIHINKSFKRVWWRMCEKGHALWVYGDCELVVDATVLDNSKMGQRMQEGKRIGSITHRKRGAITVRGKIQS